MKLKRYSTFAFAAFCGGILFLAALMAASSLPVQDFSNFWAAAKLVENNPYSHQLVVALEQSNGLGATSPWLVIKNPPWAILFLLPCRFFSYPVAFALWNVFTVIAMAACSRIIWNLFTPRSSLTPLLLSLVFGPTIVLLMLGQWTILVLLGITLFLYMIERNRDWSAGAALLLVSGKPHIALLFLLAVAFWIFRNRRLAVLYSGVILTVAASLIVLAINPHIFAQFIEHDINAVQQTLPYPNLGGLLYATSGFHLLAFLPQIAGLAWLCFYWLQNRRTWSWKREGMLVLAVSVACSYYSYSYDEIIVLPALIAAYVSGHRAIFLSGFVITELGFVLYIGNFTGGLGVGSMFLSWTATGWLITYTAATRLRQPEPASVNAYGV